MLQSVFIFCLSASKDFLTHFFCLSSALSTLDKVLAESRSALAYLPLAIAGFLFANTFPTAEVSFSSSPTTALIHAPRKATGAPSLTGGYRVRPVFVAPSVPERLTHPQRKAPQIRDTAQRC